MAVEPELLSARRTFSANQDWRTFSSLCDCSTSDSVISAPRSLLRVSYLPHVGMGDSKPSPLHAWRDICFGPKFLDVVIPKLVVFVVHIIVERVVSGLEKLVSCRDLNLRVTRNPTLYAYSWRDLPSASLGAFLTHVSARLKLDF